MAAQHGNSLRVSINNTVSVHPKTLHPPQLLNLSNLDRQCPILMYLVFFYKPSSNADQNQNFSVNDVFGKLKTGLEETLSVWYPAAGRLSLNPNNGKLNIWCNNGGAVLVEAATQVTISELGDLSQYNEFFENLVFKPVVNENLSEMPLVVAQVTRFGCGGYSLGIGTSHSLFDGPAAYDFLCEWASQSNMKMKANQALELHKPVHERGRLLMASNHQAPIEETKKSNPTIRVAAIDHLYQLIKEAARDHDQRNHENYVLTTFHLSGAMIQNLKQNVFGDKRGSFSSFEVVAAHLWKARTKALGLNKDRAVCLQFAVDTRNKMVPPLPKGFSGNAYVLASVASTVRELEEQSHETVAEKIKEAKNSVTDDYINAYIEALEGGGGGGGGQATLPPLKELTLISDWRRVPFHKIDFLGGCEEDYEVGYATPLVPPLPQVAYLMENPHETSGIDVRIGLIPTMQTVFSNYFLRNIVQ
ncbi:Brassinosteroid-related acyltransferase 1 [Camellia lanceoleosa]|uniref:Brassinosteroid-related acyltransferase 1 n=1 Tax=Camellia lanceoleosa TaxID=1840588 RepID=A0ACC0G254_9ERIC|nr:Brassinosteroid-related acyltransferase 1 [Camellia lanceoleosa]